MNAAENITVTNEDAEPAADTLTVLSTAPEKRRPLETARAVTLPWCLSRVCVQIMLSMLHTWMAQTQLSATSQVDRDVM